MITKQLVKTRSGQYDKKIKKSMNNNFAKRVLTIFKIMSGRLVRFRRAVYNNFGLERLLYYEEDQTSKFGMHVQKDLVEMCGRNTNLLKMKFCWYNRGRTIRSFPAFHYEN